MKHRHTLRAIWFVFLIMFTAPIFVQAKADFETGLSAYKRGDHALAMQEFKTAAESGDPHAQYNVGLMYTFAYGAPLDYSIAAEWFQKAAAQGLPEAQNSFGAILAQSRWPEEAVRQFQAAADQGYALAQFNLASMYAAGHGVALDPVRAHHWSALALSQGLNPEGAADLRALANTAVPGHHIYSNFFSKSFSSGDIEPLPTRFVKISRDGSVLEVQSGVWNDRGSERLGTKWSCVLDKTTGLAWEVKHRDNQNDAFVFASAAGYARNASICGAGDWRLPTRKELLSIVDSEVTGSPTIDTRIFPRVRSAFYWSSEVDPRKTDQAFGVTFSNGRVVTANQAGRNRAILVRRAK